MNSNTSRRTSALQGGEDVSDTPRLSEKFTFAINEATKQRIKKLPRGVQLGAHLRAALDEILGDIQNSEPTKKCMVCSSTDDVKRYYPLKSKTLVLNPGDGFVEYCKKHAIQNGYRDE